MKGLVQLLSKVPVHTWVAVAVVAAIIVAAVVAELVIRARFRRFIKAKLDEFAGSPAPATGAKAPSITPLSVRVHARWLESLAKKKGIPIMDIFDFREAWMRRFTARHSRKNMNRLLDFYPDDALFPCFLVAISNAARGKDFVRRLEAATAPGEGEGSFFLLKRLALSAKGRDFDTAAAKRLLGARVESFRGMTGDPEWTVRHFAAAILLEDDDPLSRRVLWDFLRDPSSSVRRRVAASFRPEADQDSRSRLHEALMGLFLGDPVLAVRTAAKRRLMADFKDLYRLEPAKLGDEESIHALELLDPASKEDENLAFSALDAGNLERRYLAARFLEASGALERLAKEADLGDREAIGRTLARLKSAASVDACGFLEAAARSDRVATLLLAAEVLAERGDASLITEVAARSFRLMPAEGGDAGDAELYRAALHAVALRGTEEAAWVVSAELGKRRASPACLAAILGEIPNKYEHIFSPSLLALVEEGGFEPADALRKALVSMGTGHTVPRLFALVKDTAKPAGVRATALGILAELKLPYLVQHVLESLPLLPEGEIARFAAMASSLDEALFNERAGRLLTSVDSRVRAAILRALPESGKKAYIKEIREALGDADPDVRIAALASLAELNEAKVISTNAVALLRDPLERVRDSAAEALGRVGSEDSLALLGKLLSDPDEVEPVKRAAMAGLGASGLVASVDILVDAADALESQASLAAALTAALARKTERKSLVHLVERFKDASPSVRHRLAAAFGAMGDTGEAALLELVGEDIASLKPVACEALDASGFVDARIKALNARDPALRKSAAKDLATVATPKAFRGIVQAARDPDPEVRVLVTKALEFLNSPQGEPILRELEKDPDRRVRKYTAWAMERLRARRME
jgi:HEAT repeat protein